jgi:hypothetical protein
MARAVNADNFHSVSGLAIEDEISPHDKISEFRREVGPRRSQTRRLGKQLARTIDLVERRVGGFAVTPAM